MDRVKRATTDDNEASGNDAAPAVPGPRVPDELITSTDNITAPPDAPIHRNTRFPTASGIDLQGATDRCSEALRATPLYDRCVNYGADDKAAFVDSCVDDIRVMHNLLSV